MMQPEHVLEIRGLATRLGNADVLCGIDLSVSRGEVVSILGPSGGGKSTLLRAINYLTPFHGGEIQLEDHCLRPGLQERTDAALLRAVRLRAGMVFQSFHLFPHLSVIENVIEAPLQVLGLSLKEARARATELLTRVGMGAHTAAYPRTLSGGQQQRVAIARALAMRPSILLLDEPTSALDPRLAGEVLAVIADLAAGGQTMMMVTHSVSFARRVSHRVVVLASGHIVETGTASEVFDSPRNELTRHMLVLS